MLGNTLPCDGGKGLSLVRPLAPLQSFEPSPAAVASSHLRPRPRTMGVVTSRMEVRRLAGGSQNEVALRSAESRPLLARSSLHFRGFQIHFRVSGMLQVCAKIYSVRTGKNRLLDSEGICIKKLSKNVVRYFFE